nr:YlaH-like family protein [Paenibacillus aurantius]
MTYVYNKVFRVRKLPILKDLIVYLMIAFGAFILYLFQFTIGLPIIYCMAAAVSLMLIVRIRYFITGLADRRRQQ